MSDNGNLSPEVSIVIPAFNEEALLAGTLRSVFDSLQECGLADHSEVIVVDNNSTDRTAAIAIELGAQVTFEPENQISRARNAGGRAATGTYLVFIDADTELSAPLLARAVANLRTQTCCGGGVVLQFDRELQPAMARLMHGWNWLSKKIGLAAGCFVYCLRDGFDAIGGFSEGVYAGEEIWFSRALKKWGRGRNLQFTVIDDVSIATSSRKMEWFSAAQLLLQTGLLVLVPWAAKSRRLCRIWYHRPAP